MPQTKPSKISVSKKEDFDDLIAQLNYIINDIYAWFDMVRGLGNKTLDTMAVHDHKSAAAGGDYPWADMTGSQLAYLAALQADITQTNLVDKSASESIGGEWTFGIFPITPSAAPDADYEVANKKYVDDNGGGSGATAYYFGAI